MTQLKMLCMRAFVVFITIGVSTSLSATELADVDSQLLKAAIASPLRTPEFTKRDKYRHPYQTLKFLGIKSDDSVVEIWPGRGWYSEVLAGYLRKDGRLYAAHFPGGTDIGFFTRMRNQFIQTMNDKAELYNGVELTEFHPPTDRFVAPVESVDAVLTFRNVHNWMKAGYGELAFETFFELLRPGGTLGVIEHRAAPGTSIQEMISSGYVTEAHVIELAKKAGFKIGLFQWHQQ